MGEEVWDEVPADIPVAGARRKPREPVVPPKPARARPVDWWALDDKARGEVLKNLAPWVASFVTAYALSEVVVPPCWYMHDSLVQELLALQQYREQDVFDKSANAAAPVRAAMEFHNHLHYALLRLRGWTAEAGCTSAVHEPVRVAPWADTEAGGLHGQWRETFTAAMREFYSVDVGGEGAA